MAAYSATKAALTAADTALARELRRVGVRVIDARPPHTETGLTDRAIAGVAPRLAPGLDPATVARGILDAMADPRRTEVAAADFDAGGSRPGPTVPQDWQVGHQKRLRVAITWVRTVVPHRRHDRPVRRYT